jgi:MFS family permease
MQTQPTSSAPAEAAPVATEATRAEATSAPANAAPRRKARAPAWFYSFLPNKMGMGATISLPPIYITEVLGGTVADVGMASALTSAATVPAAAFWGWLSDHYGNRKHYLILGYLGFAVPTLLTAFSASVWQYFLLAVLLGAWSVAGTPVSSTLIMDTVPRDEWDETFGRFNAISGWGVVAGRLVGIAAIVYGIALLGNEAAQRGLWIIAGGVSLLSIFWGWRTVPVPNMPKPRPPRGDAPAVAAQTGFPIIERLRYIPNSLYHLPRWNPRALFESIGQGAQRLPGQMGRGVQRTVRLGGELIRNPLVAYYLASFMLFMMAVGAYTPFAVWQRQELGNSSAVVFFMGMVNSVASTLTYRWMGRLISRHGSLRVQMVTVGGRFFVFGGFALLSITPLGPWGNFVVLFVLQAISGLGWAGIAVSGNTTVAHLAPRGNEGSAVGTYTSFSSIGSIVGAVVSGYLVLWTSYTFVFALGALGIGATVLLLWLIRRNASAEAREFL